MDRHKRIPSFDQNRSVLGELLPLDTPFTVIIDTSERCNFQCQYCFRADRDKSKWGYARDNQLMTWDVFTRAIAQVQEFEKEVRQISLSGHGEPLCNRELPAMVRYIKEQGIRSRVSIHTNASLLDEALAEELAESQIDRIVVSLQGITAEKYKEVCHAAICFEQFYKNLSLLYEKKGNTQIHLKIMDVALGSVEEDKFYQMFSPIGDRVFVEKAVPIWNEVKVMDAGESGAGDENKYGRAFPRQECCPLVFHTIFVAPNGDVYPCTQLLSEERLGNIREKSLLECWNGGQRKNLLRRQCEADVPALCKSCYIRQNSIYAAEDMIDNYRQEILQRLNG